MTSVNKLMDIEEDLTACASNDSELINQGLLYEKTSHPKFPSNKLRLSIAEIEHFPIVKAHDLAVAKAYSRGDEGGSTNSTAAAAFALFCFSVLLALLAILSLNITLYLIAGVVELVALILAIIALVQFGKHPEQKGRGLAMIPILLFVFGLLVSLASC